MQADIIENVNMVVDCRHWRFVRRTDSFQLKLISRNSYMASYPSFEFELGMQISNDSETLGHIYFPLLKLLNENYKSLFKWILSMKICVALLHHRY